MQPHILVLAPSPSAPVMEQLESQFICHHAWRVDLAQRDAFITDIAATQRAVVTTGMIGRESDYLVVCAPGAGTGVYHRNCKVMSVFT